MPVCPERTRGLLPGFVRSQSRAVYLEIPLRPTCHLVSELLNVSSLYALKGHEDYVGISKIPQSCRLSLDPVKAHLPSAVRATENIVSVCPERTRGLLQDL